MTDFLLKALSSAEEYAHSGNYLMVDQFLMYAQRLATEAGLPYPKEREERIRKAADVGYITNNLEMALKAASEGRPRHAKLFWESAKQSEEALNLNILPPDGIGRAIAITAYVNGARSCLSSAIGKAEEGSVLEAIAELALAKMYASEVGLQIPEKRVREIQGYVTKGDTKSLVERAQAEADAGHVEHSELYLETAIMHAGKFIGRVSKKTVERIRYCAYANGAKAVLEEAKSYAESGNRNDTIKCLAQADRYAKTADIKIHSQRREVLRILDETNPPRMPDVDCRPVQEAITLLARVFQD